MRTPLLGLALTLLVNASASAAINVATGDVVTLQGADHSPTNGGAFTARVYTHPGNALKETFQTFCVELTQHISLGSQYKITLDDNSTSTGRPLVEEVAWLYDGFIKGDIANNLQDAVQYAIWMKMGYDHELIKTNSGWTAGVLSSVALQYQAWFTNWTHSVGSNWRNVYDVKIMRLTATDGSGDFQDQLVQIPTPDVTAATPEPTTFAIWGGLATLGLAVRAYRRQG